ncbi:MAG: hypothetical protein CSA50_00405 [Gammaproteobacteria bacterium]|nr:MAG: hypothetical protein CSA50_00405 [Gammaproteobacteria bacterium]
MNNDIEIPVSPGSVGELVTNGHIKPDNLIADLWKAFPVKNKSLQPPCRSLFGNMSVFWFLVKNQVLKATIKPRLGAWIFRLN